MAKVLHIDAEECVACESCVELCPQAFKMSSSGDTAEVVNENCTDDCVEDAIATCPVDCITWQED